MYRVNKVVYLTLSRLLIFVLVDPLFPIFNILILRTLHGVTYTPFPSHYPAKHHNLPIISMRISPAISSPISYEIWYDIVFIIIIINLNYNNLSFYNYYNNNNK